MTDLIIITLKLWRNVSSYWQVDLIIFPHFLSIPVHFLVKDLVKSFSHVFFCLFHVCECKIYLCFHVCGYSCMWECTYMHVGGLRLMSVGNLIWLLSTFILFWGRVSLKFRVYQRLVSHAAPGSPCFYLLPSKAGVTEEAHLCGRLNFGLLTYTKAL